nr:isoform 4 of rab6-interacting golgin [Quercus suber]
MKNIGSSGSLSTEESEDEDISRLAISTFQAKEEEIERRKMAVKEKVELQLGRAEEETMRLAQIWDELEVLTDPMRKEVAVVRKKIDTANRDLKPLGQSCQKKEKEYKEALEAFQEKNKEKTQLIATLMELLTESEKLRMKKLEELSKNVESKN